jgi:nickel superoxide dismutase
MSLQQDAERKLKMNRIIRGIVIGLAGMLVMTSQVAAHCELPCGIYGDEMRIQMILENITTIEKSMHQITTIEQAKPVNSNQLVRWVMNKEDHANQLQEIVSQYFMTQRIEAGTKSYQEMLTTLHEMLISSMKCKQTTDLSHVEKLRKLVATFESLYFKDTQHDH